MDGKKHWNWKGKNIGYISIHSWNNRHHPKKGTCKYCRENKKTVWALKKGKKHRRGIKNYIELCQSCHIKYDMTEKWARKSLNALKNTYAHQHRIKPRQCKLCRKEFIYRRKSNIFCSNSCAAKTRPKSSYKRFKNNKGQFVARFKQN